MIRSLTGQRIDKPHVRGERSAWRIETLKIKRVTREIVMHVEVCYAFEDLMHFGCYAASSLAWRAAFGVAELLATDGRQIAI
jgi:hypothetical protein